MYEIIRKNQRKSWIIFFFMGLLLISLGGALGHFVYPDDVNYQGVITGIFIAMIIWAVQTFVAFLGGDKIILNMSNARKINADDDKELYNIVEELSIASGLPMPQVYLIQTPAMNAFATGTNPKKSIVAITSGLREQLSRNELQAVMAHEMSHVYNRDVRFMTFASIMLCTIVIISEILLRSLVLGGGSSKTNSSNTSNSKSGGGGGGGGGGRGQIIMLIVVIALAILAPILARLYYFSLSRKREYLADATAVSFTRDPESLANALEKISGDAHVFDPGKMAAAMCISKPKLKKDKENLSSTHPPISKRIDILRAMSAGTDYETYRKVYASIIGKNDLPDNKKSA